VPEALLYTGISHRYLATRLSVVASALAVDAEENDDKQEEGRALFFLGTMRVIFSIGVSPDCLI